MTEKQKIIRVEQGGKLYDLKGLPEIRWEVVFEDIPAEKQGSFKFRLLDGSKGIDRNGMEYPEDGDWLVWWLNRKYPVKGYPFTPLVEATALIKRLIMECFRFLASKPIRYFLPIILLLPKGIKKQILAAAIRSFLGTADRIAEATRHNSMMQGYYWIKPNRYCKSGQEIYRIGELLAFEKNGEYTMISEYSGLIIGCVRHLCMAWQQDSFYRFRGQDIFGEFNKEEFKKNPAKEIIRLFDIMISREKPIPEQKGIVEDMQDRWQMIKQTLYWFFKFNNWILKPLVDIIDEVDFEKLKLDDGDWYNVLVSPHYDFRGLNYEERMKIREKIDNIDELQTKISDI